MNYASDALSWYENTAQLKEPVELTDKERIDWFGEYCQKYEYKAPTKTTIGHHVIIDNQGQQTSAASFRDAIDEAAAKLQEANS